MSQTPEDDRSTVPTPIRPAIEEPVIPVSRSGQQPNRRQLREALPHPARWAEPQPNIDNQSAYQRDSFWQELIVLPDDYTDYGGTIVRWEEAGKGYPDCSGGCVWADWLDGDWLICRKPHGHRENLLTWEHQTGSVCFESVEAIAERVAVMEGDVAFWQAEMDGLANAVRAAIAAGAVPMSEYKYVVQFLAGVIAPHWPPLPPLGRDPRWVAALIELHEADRAMLWAEADWQMQRWSKTAGAEEGKRTALDLALDRLYAARAALTQLRMTARSDNA